MRFYLASWLGDGTEDNEYRPSVGEEFAAVDLRPDSTRQEGRVLVATPEALALVPQGVLDLGDLGESIPRGVSRKLEDALGVTLDQTDTIQAIIAELLILWGDNRPRGSRTRWRPLKQDRRGRHRIVMMGETLYDAPVPQGATITESFNKADSATLGPDLTWAEVSGDHFRVSDNAADNQPSPGSTHNNARAEHDLDTADHYAQAEVTWAAASWFGGVCVRFDSTAHTLYRVVGFAEDDFIRIQKFVAGSVSNLTDEPKVIGAETLTVYAEADGSTISGTVGGDPISTTDTEITGTVRAGIGGSESSGNENVIWDNFEAGDLVTNDPANLQATVDGSDVTLTWDASF